MKKHRRLGIGRNVQKVRSKACLAVVALGGGTGSFAVLSGLKHYLKLDITAIVSMADDGGSTGILRDEYGVLPPGDIRQCLVALAEADLELRELFNFRFKGGSLDGHSFGNIFLSAFEQMTGNFSEALVRAGQLLKIRGKVLPVTLDKVRLITELGTGKTVLGEDALGRFFMPGQDGVTCMRYDKMAKANPKALEAIKKADMIIVGPGGFYTSLVPLFLVPEIGKAVRQAKGKKIYVANLINKYGQTDGWSVHDHVRELEHWIGGRTFDIALANTATPASRLIRRYAEEGALVPLGKKPPSASHRLVGAPLLSPRIVEQKRGDLLPRSLIRHDPAKLARALVSFLIR